MKKIIFITLLFTGIPLVRADQYRMLYNDITGRPDFVTIVTPSSPTDSNYSGFVFDGTSLCLWIGGVSTECWVSEGSYLLLEDGTALLMENNTEYLLLESSG